ncbi:MAG: ABC transporter ATP-binding protein, partial [Clostridia bacterium]|nr:ABC transporter ATP-binding protein [Clostridia bacterium]
MRWKRLPLARLKSTRCSNGEANTMLLHAEQICFAYGEREVLQNAELSVREGEIHALIGPTGCGKTTLLHIVAGFLPPSSGTVWFGGKPVLLPSRERWMIFQSFDQLFPWMTLEQNLRYAQRRAQPGKTRASCARDTKEALGLMGLSNCVSLYPRQLSGGMRQRAALARAL